MGRLRELIWLHGCLIISNTLWSQLSHPVNVRVTRSQASLVREHLHSCVRQLLQRPKMSSVYLYRKCRYYHQLVITPHEENSVLLDLSGRTYRIFHSAIIKMEQDLAMLNTRRHSWFSGWLFSTKESKQDFDTRPKNLKKNPWTESSKARQSSKGNLEQSQKGLTEH